jgi:hypothetical protein
MLKYTAIALWLRFLAVSIAAVSFCGLKCTTFLRFKVHHSEEVFLFSLMARSVERDLLVGSCCL